MKSATSGFILLLSGLVLLVWLRNKINSTAPTANIPGQQPLNLSLSDVGARVINTDSTAQTVEELLAAGGDRAINYEDATRKIVIGKDLTPLEEIENWLLSAKGLTPVQWYDAYYGLMARGGRNPQGGKEYLADYRNYISNTWGNDAWLAFYDLAAKAWQKQMYGT